MLPLANRLKKQKDFEAVFKGGKSLKDDFLLLKLNKNNLPVSRFGFSVGLKVSKKAVVRNRARRQLREAVRLLMAEIKTGYDIVLVAGQGAKDRGFQEIKETVSNLFQKAKLLN